MTNRLHRRRREGAAALGDPGSLPDGRRCAGRDPRPALPRAEPGAAAPGVPADGHRAPLRRPGHRADQTGTSRRLPLQPRPGGLPGRRRPRDRRGRLAVPDVPRLGGPGGPRHRPGRGAARCCAATRTAGTTRRASTSRRSARRSRPRPCTPPASRTPSGARAAAGSRWSSSATARPARATSTRRSTSPRCSRRR